MILNNSNKKSHAAILRQKAEELLNDSDDSTVAQQPLLNDRKTHQLSEVEALKLIHELEVHQIELELQNDQLRHAWAVAEIANDKYLGLYDFAPSGYFTLSKEGVTTFEPASFLLKSIIAESLKSILESAGKKEIAIRFEIPEDMNVYADGYMLGSTIRNLVSNAMKFTPKGGEITIKATSTIGNFDEISVKDTGIGMNKNMMDNLFRLDEHTNRKGTEGEASTGLGLIICREFIEKHGGRLWVDSEEGKGSTFCFSLPNIHR